jgi:hypothetical protein
MSYGKSNYSKETYRKTGKPAKGPGNNIFRIMPAMFSLAEEGIWAKYYTTHWGYQGVHPSDQNKNVVRPFRCIEDKNRQTGMVRQNCPECDLFNQKEKEAKAFQAALEAEVVDGKPKFTEDEIKTKMKSRNDWLQAHAPERKWYINVMNPDRTFNDYKINHKTHKKGIDTKIQELLESDIDATDLDTGVWFNIKRTGDGFTTPDTVEVVQKPIEGKKGSFEIALAPLTPEEQKRGLKECRDLATLGGAVLTHDQIRDLTLSGGDPEKVDKIFGGRLGGGATAAQRTERHDDPEDESTNEAPAVKNEAPAPSTASPPAGAGKPAANQAAIQARVQAILAERAAKAKAEAEAKAAAEAAAAEAEAQALAEATAAEGGVDLADTENAMNMDNDTFMKTFGGGAQKTA